MGKTAIGNKLADKINLPFIDLDEFIENKTSLRVAQIFERHGEHYFRKLEKEACREISRMPDAVIATGGRTLLDERNKFLLSSSGLIVTLLCSQDKIFQRIRNEPNLRPLLASNSKDDFSKIYRQREALYQRLPNKIDVTNLGPDKAAEEIMKLFSGREISFEIKAGEERSSVLVKTGIIGELGVFFKDYAPNGKAFVLSDNTVFSLYGQRLLNGLEEAGLESKVFLLTPGESRKNLGSARRIYDWLEKERATRSALFICFGGGVISDIGGFTASTFHRGLPLVNIPTTLLAQVDASIGGKNAINLKDAKNQIGTFFFPRHVLIDPLFLVTLNRRQMQEGLIEALKVGIIADGELYQLIKNHIPELMANDIGLLEQVISRAVGVKSRVVNQDPYEKNTRRVLNLGHTFGHALEGSVKYRRISHGQAVGLGMICAAKLGKLLGITPAYVHSGIKDVLSEMKAPIHLRDGDTSTILSLMEFDKKKRKGKMVFVVPKKIGEVVITQNVKKKDIIDSLEEIKHG